MVTDGRSPLAMSAEMVVRPIDSRRAASSGVSRSTGSGDESSGLNGDSSGMPNNGGRWEEIVVVIVSSGRGGE
jgi:hypothetical protein